MSERPDLPDLPEGQTWTDCSTCNGDGWVLGVGTEAGHGCDGTEADCARTCPVPIPVQVQEECPDCYHGQVPTPAANEEGETP